MAKQPQGMLPSGLPNQPGPGGLVHRQQTEIRPAALTPEIIAKFEPRHIDQLVNSLTESIKYQDETQRIVMKDNFGTARFVETVKYALTGVIVLSSLFALYLSIPWQGILAVDVPALTAIFWPPAMQGMANVINRLAGKKEQK